MLASGRLRDEAHICVLDFTDYFNNFNHLIILTHNIYVGVLIIFTWFCWRKREPRGTWEDESVFRLFTLFLHIVCGEEELSEDASKAPHITLSTVFTFLDDDLWSPVPPRNNMWRQLPLRSQSFLSTSFKLLRHLLPSEFCSKWYSLLANLLLLDWRVWTLSSSRCADRKARHLIGRIHLNHFNGKCSSESKVTYFDGTVARD